MSKIVYPGLFSVAASCDVRRVEFDCKNRTIIENNTQVDFVFLGDSITELWELPVYFGKAGQVMVNRGISGDCSYYIAKRFIADAVQLKPRYCILLCGINDTWEMEFDSWARRPGLSSKAVLRKTLPALQSISSSARENGMNLIFCSVLPTDMDFTNRESERKQHIVALNAEIRKLCQKHRHIYVDYHTAMAGADGLSVKPNLTKEGLHPHVKGYNIMARVLKKTLEEHDIAI